MMLDVENFNTINIAFTVALAVGVWRVVKVICDIVENQVLGKLTYKYSIKNGSNGRVTKLELSHEDLRNYVKESFKDLQSNLNEQHTALGTKLDTQSQELHRRISELRETVTTSQIRMAERYATKDDLINTEKRLTIIKKG